MKKLLTMRRLVFFFLSLFSCSAIIGQIEVDELVDKSLEELLSIKVSVSSKIKETNRETPSIITVITHQDIKNNHCRDMVDVLNMIPGFVITKDEDYTTFSSRGLFGFEGRSLILIDEMRVSDLYFGAYVIGNDFPIHLIERIEVIRGAGSVLYGGMAELAVIKIVTHSDEMESRGNITLRYGQLPESMGHADAGFSFTRTKNEFSVSAIGHFGKARRTDAEARYLRGNAVYQHNEQSAGLESGSFVVNSKFKNTQLGLLFNHYKNNQIRRFTVDPLTGDDSEDDAVFSTLEEGMEARKVKYKYTTFGANLTHQFELSENFKIIPTLNYHYNYPFNRNTSREEVVIQRFKPSVYGLFTYSKIDVILGGEYFFDAANIVRPNGSAPLEHLRKSINDEGEKQYFNIQLCPVW
jgi:outer membrane receptor for ferrienterochelin and colicin